ncbi:hypothetical protein ACJMK2_021373 [Sinanodonta woodiana]|uniref:RUN domain-containing protein n=1 Tax=Sinanodonta woodiana TaxID=1069815 RepID=A0ABD3THV9_SINWO
MKMPIMDVSDSKKKFSSRQISAQRRNLITVCRFAMKTLIDKAVLTSIDDGSDEVTNFLAILEKILSHMLKPQKSWYGMEEPGSFWLYIQDACKSVPRSCISGIAALDNVKPAIAKGRAWLRCVLMEKRLSEYLTTAVHNTWLTRKYYFDGAIMLSEDVHVLFAELLGLNAIDFSFCLKGNNIDLSTSAVVDYSPYLKFEQSRESLIHDEEELRALSMKSSVDSRVSTEMTDEELDYVQKYQLLDHKYRSTCEQKGFLEELLRLRENQLDAVQQQHQDMVCSFRLLEKENRKNRNELECVIIELQEQLSKMKMKYAQLQQSLTNLPDYPTPPSKLDKDKIIPMEDLGSIGSLALSPATVKQMDSDQQSLSSLECSLPPVTSTSTSTCHHSYSEDTQSMIPLTGSLTSQQSMILLAEPLTPQQSIKIYTGSYVSEENGQYTEYISFGPAFTKDIGAIFVPMEHEDTDVITLSDHEDIDVISPFEHAGIDVISPFEHADIDVITLSEQEDTDVITLSEHEDIDVISPMEGEDIDVISPYEHAEIDAIASIETADIDVISSFETADIDVISSSERSEIDVITSSERSEIDVITSSERSEYDAITSSERSEIDVITSSERSEYDAITSSERSEYDAITSSERSEIDVISSSERSEIDVISSSERSDIDVITSMEHADVDFIASFEAADIDVISSFEHVEREKQDSVSSPSMSPERTIQSNRSFLELSSDYLSKTDFEQRDNQTGTDKIVSSKDPNFINDNVPPAVEESFFVMCENPEAVGNQDSQPVKHSSQDSGEFNPEAVGNQDSQPVKHYSQDLGEFNPEAVENQDSQPVKHSSQDSGEFNPEAVENQDSQPVEHSSQDSGEFNPEAVGNQDSQPVKHSSQDSGELSLESSRDQGQITLHSFANMDTDDSVDTQTSQILLAEIFEEMEDLEQTIELEEKSANDKSTMNESEFVFLDANI